MHTKFTFFKTALKFYGNTLDLKLLHIKITQLDGKLVIAFTNNLNLLNIFIRDMCAK